MTVVETQKKAIDAQKLELDIQYKVIEEYKEQLSQEKKNSLKYKIGIGILSAIVIGLATK